MSNSVAGIPLSEGETVRHDLRPSWANYKGHLLFSWLVYPLYRAWRKRKKTRFIITTERLIIKEGSLLGSTATNQYELANVERIETKQSLIQGWSGAGTVTVHMRHEHQEADQFDVTLPAIPNHQEVARTLRNV
jgi:hypothetical protein